MLSDPMFAATVIALVALAYVAGIATGGILFFWIAERPGRRSHGSVKPPKPTQKLPASVHFFPAAPAKSVNTRPYTSRRTVRPLNR